MNLEDFLQDNRDGFEDKKLPKSSRSVFEKKLKKQLHAQPKVFKLKINAWKIAASILLLIGAYTFGRFHEGSNFSDAIVQIKSENKSANETIMLSLMGNSSPHERINGINYIDEISNPSEAIINALIERLLYDQNVNVRIMALRGLESHIGMTSVRVALIKSLGTEKDSRILISIIHNLISINEKRALVPIQELLEKEDLEPKVKEHITAVLPQLM